MTRDEAIKILSRIWGGNPQHDLANSYADAFVDLGMLKLDEPKSAEDGFIQHLVDRGFSKRNAIVVRQALDYANLKIVEK